MSISAAVLIPIIKLNGESHILYERRAFDLAVQPGDVCFPGGGIEPGETPMEAVIRETCEELLIESSQIKELKEFTTVPGPHHTSNVYVFTGTITGYNNTFSTDEVESVFTVPVNKFPKDTSDNERYPEYLYGGYRIWGFTARVTRMYNEK